VLPEVTEDHSALILRAQLSRKKDRWTPMYSKGHHSPLQHQALLTQPDSVTSPKTSMFMQMMAYQNYIHKFRKLLLIYAAEKQYK